VALIEVRGLTKVYPMGGTIVRALDGVDLQIERGEFVAITGASGSGKSTMMHLLGCLDRPTAGEYLLDGHAVSDLSDRELAEVRNAQIGFVFQTFNLINRTSAVDNVGVPLFYARRNKIREPALNALGHVGLAARAHHHPNELSGGERQRVAIARAIVNNPALLLADEPTGNLDSRTGEQIMAIFRQLNEQGVTIVMVTHEPDIAMQARRIVAMKDGRILSDRLVSDLVAEGALVRPSKWRSGDGEGPVAAELDARAPIDLPERRMRGTTASLVCGIIAAVLSAGTVIGPIYIAQNAGGFDPQSFQPGDEFPQDLLVAGSITCGALLATVIMGLVALLLALGARRRLRTEPGRWRGHGRALAGLILGIVALVAPLVTLGIMFLVGPSAGGPGS
jgi:putative ABC transport system ATP-binding protein